MTYNSVVQAGPICSVKHELPTTTRRGKPTKMENDSKAVRTEPSDFFLEMMLEFAERGRDIPITLNVKGLVISGVLISEKSYWESFASGALKAMILKAREEGRLEFPEDESDKSDDDEPYEYIHLKNAKIYYPGLGSIPGKGHAVLWRGRISSIDGYSEQGLGVEGEDT
jgi:hypothetical protein